VGEIERIERARRDFYRFTEIYAELYEISIVSVNRPSDGNTVLVAAYGDKVGANSNEGSAYYFTLP
jgi:hypothetical protein